MAKEIAALQTTEAVGRSFFCFFYYFEKENGIKDLLELLLIFFYDSPLTILIKDMLKTDKTKSHHP
jgi:hypothetical protein